MLLPTEVAMRRFFAFCLIGTALCLGLAPAAMGQTPRSSGAFRLEPQRPGAVDIYILSFGLWGPQSVFESEAKGAARVLEAQLGSSGRSIVRFNTKRRFEAKPDALLAA